MNARPFFVEQRPLVAQRKRYGIRPDDKARIDGALRLLRDMPREVIINRDEIIHFVHRQAAVIQAVAADLEVLQPAAAREPRRLQRQNARQDAEAVFSAGASVGKSKVSREHVRSVLCKGRSVRVVERGVCGRQMELGL